MPKAQELQRSCNIVHCFMHSECKQQGKSLSAFYTDSFAARSQSWVIVRNLRQFTVCIHIVI